MEYDVRNKAENIDKIIFANALIDDVNYRHDRNLKHAAVESNNYLWDFYNSLNTAINKKDTNE